MLPKDGTLCMSHNDRFSLFHVFCTVGIIVLCSVFFRRCFFPSMFLLKIEKGFDLVSK